MSKHLGIGMIIIFAMFILLSSLVGDRTHIISDNNIHVSEHNLPNIEITRYNYIRILANFKKIPLSEAGKYDKEQSIKIMERYIKKNPNIKASGSFSYMTISKIKQYSGIIHDSVLITATIKIFTCGNHKEIDDVVGTQTKLVNEDNNTVWKQGYAWSDPTSGSSNFPTTTITLGASGYFVRNNNDISDFINIIYTYNL